MNSEESFGVIRATVEADVAPPGVLTVSSARAGDGKTAVALGIARALAGAGYRALLIDAGSGADSVLTARLELPAPPPVAAAAAAADLAGGVRPAFGGCDVLRLSSDGGGPSAVAITGLFAAARAAYDYTIVDARTVAEGGAVLARLADAVLLAVREGRPSGPADTEAVAVLDRVRARFLGVVAIAETRSSAAARASNGARVGARGALPGAFSRLRDLFASD